MVVINDNIIYITQGDTLETEVELYRIEIDEYGEEVKIPYEFSEGDKIRFALKSDEKSSDVLLNIDIPIDTLCLLIPANKSKMIQARKKPYMYDIQLTYDKDKVNTFITEGKYYSLPEVE